MTLKIGEQLRQHRRERNMTQEQLAERLGVSFQAVSRWENGAAYPDIELLPVLAELFETSVDELMGYDAEKTAAEVARIIRQYNNLHANGRYDEAEKLIRDARKTYPNSYEIMCHYMWCVSGSKFSVNVTKLNEHYDELSKICDAILSGCTVEWIRLEVIAMKAKLEQAAGHTDAAMETIYQFPRIHQSKEFRQEELFSEDTPEYLERTRNSLYQLAQYLGFRLVRSIWLDSNIDPAERLKRIETLGDTFTELGAKHGETALHIIAWAIFSHLNLKLICNSGCINDNLRITEKELNAIATLETTAKTDTVLEKSVADAHGRTTMLKYTVDRLKNAEQEPFSKLRTHPEFMEILEKFS